MTDRTFRFGVIVPKSGSGKELTEQARRAEALGFSSLFVPDHFIDHDLAPTVALAHVAAVTETLRVGPLVLGNDYKHPVVLAREMATLDLLSDGRLELGIGAGWMTADYEKAGMPLDRAGVRIARLAESIAILKGLFAPGPFTFHGDHYQVTELDGMPKPPQGANLPFLIGGGAKKILGLAAREAKIVGINANLRTGEGESRETAQSLLPEATDQKLTWLREAAGDGFADLEIQSLLGFVHVTDNPAGIAKAMADSFGVSEPDAILAPATLVGSVEGIIETLHQRRERWQMSYIVVPIESTETLAPVVERLAGKQVHVSKPFRFGVQIANATSAAAWRDKARKLEDLGYSTLFMPDHFGEELAPLPAIAMAAAHTTTLKIGALVFDNDYKHPAILAKESATIDLLSDGRLELGIGAGWMKTDYDALGLDYDPPAVRVDRFEEALHVIKQCFTGEKFSYKGTHYRITDYASYPKPVQAHLPILVGGGGKRVLSIVAREADIIGINPNLRAGAVGLDATKDSLQEQTDRKLDWVREAAGGRMSDIEIQMRFFVCSVTDDRMALAKAIAPGFGVEPEEALESGAALVGTETEIIEQLHARRERWDLSYVVVGDENIDEFAPIVAKLTGN